MVPQARRIISTRPRDRHRPFLAEAAVFDYHDAMTTKSHVVTSRTRRFINQLECDGIRIPSQILGIGVLLTTFGIHQALKSLLWTWGVRGSQAHVHQPHLLLGIIAVAFDSIAILLIGVEVIALGIVFLLDLFSLGMDTDPQKRNFPTSCWHPSPYLVLEKIRYVTIRPITFARYASRIRINPVSVGIVIATIWIAGIPTKYTYASIVSGLMLGSVLATTHAAIATLFEWTPDTASSMRERLANLPKRNRVRHVMQILLGRRISGD